MKLSILVTYNDSYTYTEMVFDIYHDNDRIAYGIARKMLDRDLETEINFEYDDYEDYTDELKSKMEEIYAMILNHSAKTFTGVFYIELEDK